MNWTNEQLRQWETEHEPSLAQPQPAKQKPWAPYRSKTEARYADYLDLMAKTQQIDGYRYEALTLTLAAGVRYTPDFLVLPPCGSILGVAFHEVKGRKGTGFWALPVGKVKVRLAAALFPWWTFYVVWPGERVGTWDKILIPSR